MFIYSYLGYTISQNISSGICYITYPNEIEASIYTRTLGKAYQFVNEMTQEVSGND